MAACFFGFKIYTLFILLCKIVDLFDISIQNVIIKP